MEAFHAQLIQELRQVPGIVLLPADDKEVPANAMPLYRLTVASLPTTRLDNGGESYASRYEPNRRGMYTPMSGLMGTQWPVEIRVERNGRLAPASSNQDAIVHLARDGVPRPAICAQELRPQRGVGLLCLTSAQLAAHVADGLRLQVLPPDQGIYDKLVGRIRDGSLSERQRSLDLNSLMMARRTGHLVALDAEGTQAIIAFATSSSSAMRGTIWRLLRGDPVSGFVDPMIDSLRGDADPETRLEALTTLVEDHGKEPRVRVALEVAAREDPRELNRMLARRALGGEIEWRRYVIATLQDSRQSTWDRTGPLLYAEQRMQTPQQQAHMTDLVRTAEFTDVLLGAARESRSVTGAGERGTIRRCLNLLIRFGDPAVLARHADWNDLQREFAAGQVPMPTGPPEWTGLAPVTAGETPK